MKIETKLNLGDECFFIMGNKIRKAIVKSINVFIENNKEKLVKYEIEENPLGDYRTYFYDNELFKTKQDLLNSL